MKKVRLASSSDFSRAESFIKIGINEQIKKNPQALKRALFIASKKILEKAVKLAPLDTGDLRESGRIRDASRGDSIKFVVEFTAPYAPIVHEDMEVNHPAKGPKKRNPARRAPRPTGQLGQAKFLETAFKEFGAGGAITRLASNAVFTSIKRGRR